MLINDYDDDFNQDDQIENGCIEMRSQIDYDPNPKNANIEYIKSISLQPQ